MNGILLLPMMTIAGFAFGIGYFAVLRRTTVLLGASRGWLGPVALTLARLAAAGIYLAIVAHYGAAALLTTFIGFLLARIVTVRPIRGAV